MLLERTYCNSNLVIGISPVVDFVAGVIQLGLLAITVVVLNLIPWVTCLGQKHAITIVAPIYFLVLFYAIALALAISVFGILGLSYEFVEADFVKWVIFRSCSEGLAIFLLHNGIGVRAMRHAIFGGIAWALVSGGIPVIIYHSAKNENLLGFLIATIFFSALLMIFYIITLTAPMSWLHRRPAMISYSFINIVLLAIFIGAMSFLLVNDEASSCEVEIIVAFYYNLQPFVIIYALRQDSLFWQGLYEAPGSSLNQPLLGVWEMGSEVITAFADTVNQLERKVVPIVPFAQLEVDTSKFFSGGTARVYRGMYKKQQVAIKFAFTIELTPETVVNFCAEATTLHSLHHPNIVKCFGVAVMPPALCLITEYCHYGSLYDFLHSLDLIVRESRTSSNSHYSGHSPEQRHTGSSSSSEFHADETKNSESLSVATGNVGNRLTWHSSIGSSLTADDVKRPSSTGASLNAIGINFDDSVQQRDSAHSSDGKHTPEPSISMSPPNAGRPNPLLANIPSSSNAVSTATLSNKMSFRNSPIPSIDSKTNLLEVHAAEINPIIDAKILDISHANTGNNQRLSGTSSTSQVIDGDGRAVSTESSGRSNRDIDVSRSVNTANYAVKLAELLEKRQASQSEGCSSENSALSITTLEKMGFSIDVRISKDSTESGPDSNSRDKRKGSHAMKPLAKVMTSKAMRFGLGPLSTAVSQNSSSLRGSRKDFNSVSTAHSHGSSQVSNGKLLASAANKTRLSLGSTLPLPLRMSMARDAICGVAFLHRSGLIHCDIKSLNFLVTGDLVLKLADLGEARSTDLRNSQVGHIPRNINWSSPESLTDSTISKSADIWSLALVLSEIFSGQVPFDTPELRDVSFDEFRKRVENGLRPHLPSKIITAYPWLAEMMPRAWAYQPNERPTAEEMLQFFDKNYANSFVHHSPPQAQ